MALIDFIPDEEAQEPAPAIDFVPDEPPERTTTLGQFPRELFGISEESKARSDALAQAASTAGLDTPEGKQKLADLQAKYRFANQIASTPEARDKLARDEQAEFAALGVQTVGLDEPVSLPKLDPTEQKTLFGTGRLASAAGATQRALSGVAEGFASPEGAGMFLPGAAGKLIGKAFMAEMVKSVPEKVATAAGAYSGGDAKAGDEALIDAAVTSGMLVVPHFLSRGERPKTLEEAVGSDKAQSLREAVKESAPVWRRNQIEPATIPETRRITIPAPERTEENAIQIGKPAPLPVEEQSQGSAEVGQGISKPEEVALPQSQEINKQTADEAGKVLTPPEPLSYEDFSKQYKSAFDSAMKYKPTEIGSQVFTEKMANLADSHPEYLKRLEAEEESAAKPEPQPSAVKESLTTEQPAPEGSRPWHDQHGEEIKQSVFKTMREIQSRVDASAEQEKNLRPPQGTIAAGAAGFDEFMRSESQAQVLRGVRKGLSPDEAGAEAKAWAKDAIESHNKKRPKDINWARAQEFGQSYIDHTVELINDSAKPDAAKDETAQAISKVSAEVKDVARTEGQRPAKEVKSELISRIEKAIADAPNAADVQEKRATKVSGQSYVSQESTKTKITIDIPGDGEFTVDNTKEALTELLDRAKSISTTKGTAPRVKSTSVGNISEQAKDVSKVYGSPEKAYQSVKRQREALQSQEPPRTAEDRTEWNKQIEGAGKLMEELYGQTNAATLETKAEAARDRVATYKTGAEGFEKEIAKVEAIKNKTKAHKDRLADLKLRYGQNQEFIRTNEKNASEWEQQAAKEKMALEATDKPKSGLTEEQQKRIDEAKSQSYPQQVKAMSDQQLRQEVQLLEMDLKAATGTPHGQGMEDESWRRKTAGRTISKLEIAQTELSRRNTGTHREQAEKIASALEQLKAADPIKGGLSTFGVIPDLWNRAVSVVQSFVRAGGSVADAVEAGLKYIRDNFKGKWDESGARKAFTSMVNSPPETDETRTRNRQVMGQPMGPLQEIESIPRQQKAIREHFFDATKEVSEKSTETAWDLAQELTGENKAQNLSMLSSVVKDSAGLQTADMSPALLVSELRTYALKLAAKGDRSLMDYLVTKRVGVIDPNAALDPTQAGRTLRALQESVTPFWKAVTRLTEESDRAAGRVLKVGKELFNQLMDAVENLWARPEDIEGRMPEDLIKKVKPSTPEEEMEAGAEQDANNAEKTAKAMLHRFELKQGAEWVKPDKKNIVREIVKEFLTPKKGEEKALAEESFKHDLLDRLTDPVVGVSRGTARELAQTVWNEAYTRWANRRARAMDRAAGTGNPLRPLIEQILGTPYRAQHDPAWRQQTAENWFMAKGLTREQSVAAAKMFSKQFDSAIREATERRAKQLMEQAGAKPQNVQQLLEAIRLGLTDPSKSWSDRLAEREGFKPLTAEQHAKLAELDLKLSQADGPDDFVNIVEQMNAITRHTGPKADRSYLMAMADAYAASLLSGPKTIALHLFQPMMHNLGTFAVKALTSNPADLPSAARGLIDATKVLFPELKAAWTKDAYAHSAHQMQLHTNRLKQQFEIALGEIKSKEAGKVVRGVLRMNVGLQQYTVRALQTANQGNAASVQAWKIKLYGSRVLREAGFGTKEVSLYMDMTTAARRAGYEYWLGEGKTANEAAAAADSMANELIQNHLNNVVGDTAAGQVMKAAEHDAYLVMGRLPPGIGEAEEGFLSRPVNTLMQAISKMRGKGGGSSVLGIMLFGFANVPFRLTRYYAGYSPYGFFRYGINKYRSTEGRRWLFNMERGPQAESFWKASYANEVMARENLKNAIVGTTLMGAFLGWQATRSTADDNDKLPFGIWATGSGPHNRELRDAWQKQGFRPFSLAIKYAPGPRHIISIPITRVGEIMAWPLGLAGVEDDIHWRGKEQIAAGKPGDIPFTRATGIAAATYYQIVGAQGLLSSASHFIELGRGEGFSGKAIGGEIAGVASAAVIPFKQLLQTVQDIAIGKLDRTSTMAAITAQAPVLGAVPGLIRDDWKRNIALNRLGDPLGDRSFAGKISNLGLPFTFTLSDTPENRAKYGLLVNKGAAPGENRRSVIEEKYGILSDEQWSKFNQISGAQLSRQLLSASNSLQNATPEDVKKFVTQAGTDGNNAAAAQLGLERKPTPAQLASAGAGSGLSAPNLPSERGLPSTGVPRGTSGGSTGGPTRVPAGSTSKLGLGRRLGPSGARKRLVSGRLSSRGRGRIRLSKPRAKRIRLRRVHA